MATIPLLASAFRCSSGGVRNTYGLAFTPCLAECFRIVRNFSPRPSGSGHVVGYVVGLVAFYQPAGTKADKIKGRFQTGPGIRPSFSELIPKKLEF